VPAGHSAVEQVALNVPIPGLRIAPPRTEWIVHMARRTVLGVLEWMRFAGLANRLGTCESQARAARHAPRLAPVHAGAVYRAAEHIAIVQAIVW